MNKMYNFIKDILKVSVLLLITSYLGAIYLSMINGNIVSDVNSLINTITTIISGIVLVYFIFKIKNYKQITQILTITTLTLITVSSGVLVVI